VEVSSAIAPQAQHRSRLFSQLSRFIAVGCVSAMVDYGLYQTLLHLDIYVHLAKAISFICGTTTAYLLNKRFTFNVGSGQGAGRFTSFLLLYGSTFFVNVGVNALALKALPDGMPFEVTICWVLAQGTATSLNFLILRTVIFRAPELDAMSGARPGTRRV
jgi:putative flippase GtrA